MGSIVNPLINRTGISHYWHNIWCISNSQLNAYYGIVDYQINNIIFYYIKKQIILVKKLLFPFDSFFMIYCLRLLRCSNSLILLLSFPIFGDRIFIKKKQFLLKKKFNKYDFFFQQRKKLNFFYPSLFKTIIIKNIIYKFFFLYNMYIRCRDNNILNKKNYLFKFYKKISLKIIFYYLIFLQFKMKLLMLLKKFILNNNFFLLFEFFSNVEKDAKLLVRTFIWLLRKRQKLITIFKKFLFFFTKYIQNGILRGYKLLFSGRSERRGRSNYMWQSRGLLGLSTYNVKLNYNHQLVILTNSICSIKVWIIATNYTSRFLFFL